MASHPPSMGEHALPVVEHLLQRCGATCLWLARFGRVDQPRHRGQPPSKEGETVYAVIHALAHRIGEGQYLPDQPLVPRSLDQEHFTTLEPATNRRRSCLFVLSTEGERLIWHIALGVSCCPGEQWHEDLTRVVVVDQVLRRAVCLAEAASPIRAVFWGRPLPVCVNDIQI